MCEIVFGVCVRYMWDSVWCMCNQVFGVCVRLYRLLLDSIINSGYIYFTFVPHFSKIGKNLYVPHKCSLSLHIGKQGTK